jgi:rhamnulokinase
MPDAGSRYLALDLGAESGRAILGELRSGVLGVREVGRFPNEPVRDGCSLRWDMLRLWLEIQKALEGVSGPALDSIGVDTWGVDYALVGEQGHLLENPYHYRDRRTEGVMDAVCERVSREEIYSSTGVQFISFNTLYQWYAARRATPRLLDAAEALVTIPDLLNYWLTGKLCSEYTVATTTQFVDPRTRSWAKGLLSKLDLPARLLQPIVEPGAILGPLKSDASAAFAGTPVIAPACHDTGSAFASVSASSRSAFLSSGTWSLLGAELLAPVISPEARELNFTNEGGVCGTVRFLKNITGLWLLQSCRRCWAASGQEFSYDELLTAADGQNSFHSLLDPDHSSFLRPANMLSAIVDYCRETGQPAPNSPPAYARAILESLSFKYRMILEWLEQLTGISFEEIRIVGGGSRNRLLNQFTADSTGRRVIAGPVEATALGNIAMQMLATGAVTSLAEARRIIDRSFPVERFEPSDTDRWNLEYQRFRHYVNASHHAP